jgi:chain length determinant protein EpsF
MPGYIATQTDIITSRNVALKVVDQLKLANDVSTQEQFRESTHGKGNIREWLADQLLQGLDVQPSRESSVIELSFTSTDSAFAADMANAFANAYQQTNLQLKIEPAQKAAEFLGTQTKSLRTNLEAAQTKLSKYQQEKGLTSATGSLDVESTRLNELSSQLAIAQSQSDISTNPVVQNLKIAIASAQSKLSELSQHVGVNHPQYKAAWAELEKLKSQLLEETSKTANSNGAAYMYKQHIADIGAALNAQKNRVLELNRSKSELSVLQQDVDNAQRALDATSQRFTQTTLEGNVNQTDVAILNPATIPLKATSPKILINTLISIILGGMLGISFGLLAEMMDRRVRNRDDISDLLEIPVLAIIQKNPARRHRLFKVA